MLEKFAPPQLRRCDFLLGKPPPATKLLFVNPTLRAKIAEACAATKPRTRARNAALAKIRWVLAARDGRFVSVDEQLAVGLTNDLGAASVYDARDNETLKRRFMATLLNVNLSVVLLEE